MSLSMPEESRARYMRQIQLEEIGPAGQERLAKAHVAVVGAGGLGVPVATYLAAAGVGQLSIWDYDTVNISNLNRQFLYGPQDVGQKKADLACARLQVLYPNVQCTAHTQKVSAQALDLAFAKKNTSPLEHASSVIPSSKAQSFQAPSALNIILCCVDNFTTRHELNAYVLQRGLWIIDGGVDGFYGYVQTVQGSNKQGPCLACGQALSHETSDCVAAVGPICGVIASLQASICMQIILDMPAWYAHRLISFDGKRGELESIPLVQNPHCAAHG